MNMMKKTGGFTLVELIVVIAILAILAGVAVPAYSGYITKANEAADLTWLDSAKTAIVFAATEKSASANVTGATVTFDKLDEVEITGTNLGDDGKATSDKVDITDFVAVETYNAKSKAPSATWNGEKWTLAAAN